MVSLRCLWTFTEAGPEQLQLSVWIWRLGWRCNLPFINLSVFEAMIRPKFPGICPGNYIIRQTAQREH